MLFAAERTLLAWNRTSLNLVVAVFGIVLAARIALGPFTWP
ncbi:MAG TPA: DUF202 domain-containing protein [Burkholderiaceae bacterium]|nr:DUF202 domain-containing protein [Burkholderiaceae bacterium]